MNSSVAPPRKPDAIVGAERAGAPKAYGLALKGSRVTPEKIDAIAKDFEAQFVSEMTSTMFSTVEPNEELGGGDAEEVYRSMLTSEYGKILARTGGIGVADQVKTMMLNQQEVN